MRRRHRAAHRLLPRRPAPRGADAARPGRAVHGLRGPHLARAPAQRLAAGAPKTPPSSIVSAT
ncbi:MAG: hypothetical protein AVDCRST_MAG13-2983 [uncultured Solirubrobacteraceae bacterium]|uniref:Uncharacterized protein n=1 Tax=uncultured Solirubrobacteraceae bacterium TaxID=1162706 RepID=A0A6J4T6C8_9ACTN|nr:MAG: hypothetical protein AVDCRST_MAG13-2983 [uncultured Solirubrobacteraceae bacterium]